MTMTEPDFMAALHGYIQTVTGLDGKVIFQGNQSRMVLPKSGAYCIYTPLLRQRRGTNLYNFDAEGLPDDKNGEDTLLALVLVDVQCDFYETDAMKNAQAMEIASRSYIGSDYFKQNKFDVRVLTSDAPRNLTGIDASNQYAERWTVTITTEVNSCLIEKLPWFEDVTLKAFKNVDVWFPPSAG